MSPNGILIAVIFVTSCVCAVCVYRRGVEAGTDRWMAAWIALLLGPLALPLVWGTPRRRERNGNGV